MSRLLLIDDDALVLGTLRRLIRAVVPEVEVETAASGSEGLARLGREPFDAILSDRHMPGMGGEAVLAAAAGLCPATVRGLISGDNIERPWVSPLVFARLSKPCPVDELGRAIRLMIDLAALQRDPAIGRTVAEFHQKTSAIGGQPYDGRTCGRRWFEAHAAVAGSPVGGRSTSASVLRLMGPELSEPLAILVGAFESAAVIVPDGVEELWSAALGAACRASGTDEHDSLTAKIVALAARVGDLAGRVLGASPALPPRLGIALLAEWGFTTEIVGPLNGPNQWAIRPGLAVPRLDRSPMEFAHVERRGLQ